MSVILLGLFLITAQPLHPLPRQAVDKQTEQSDKKHEITKQRKDAAEQLTTAPTAPAYNASAYNTYNFATKANPEATKQSEPWSRSERLTAVYDCLTALLVAIGFIGILYAFRTVKATENAATAALLNAQAAINAERPWVIVFYDGWKDGTFRFSAANKGRTPADIVSFAVGFACLSSVKELPPKPEYGPETIPTNNLLMPSESEWSHTLVLISQADCESQMERCHVDRDKAVQFPKSGEKLPIFYFRVKYRIMLGGGKETTTAETRTCYSVSPFDRSISVCGGDAYNRYE